MTRENKFLNRTVKPMTPVAPDLNDVRWFPIAAKGQKKLDLQNAKTLGRFLETKRYREIQDDPEQFMLCKEGTDDEKIKQIACIG